MHSPIKDNTSKPRSIAAHRKIPAAPAWPSYVGTSQYVGTSPSGRTTVYVDPALGAPALQNAQDLVSDADRIAIAIDAIFGTTGGPVNVIVFALGGATDGTGGADHMGCDYSSGAAIEVCASFGNSARVSALFAVILSECSMGGNLCSVSTGEALSRWCAAVIGNNALPDFATAPQWVQDGMPDFINLTDPTDQNPDSTGAGMAFLSWLRRLGYRLDQIAQAMVSQGGSGTLAQLYSNLSGDAASNAWPKFKQAVTVLRNGVTSDDPFFQLPGTPRHAWPSYTGSSQFVGTSPSGRTSVYVDPTLGAPGLQNAQDLVNDADRVANAIDAIFGTPGGSVSVMVFALNGTTDGTGGAVHSGCNYTTGAAMEVCASFGNSARVSALFAAILSECSMGGNLCGVSTGEALSRWCANVLSNNALPDFATASVWAQNGMPDYITQTDPTDQNPDSTGAGMAFLSWLRSRGYALEQIARAMVSLGQSGTWAQLYANLTGDLASSALPNFLQAVLHLPNGVTSDDPFSAPATSSLHAGSSSQTVGIVGPAEMKRTAEIHAIQTFQRFEQRFESLLSEPKLDNFDGTVYVRLAAASGNDLPLQISGGQTCYAARPGERCHLGVSFAAGPPRAESGGLQQELRIRRGNKASEVTFDVFLDSQTVEPVNERSSITFNPNAASAPLIFELAAPQRAGEHELFVEISQKNRLLQTVLVELRVADH